MDTTSHSPFSVSAQINATSNGKNGTCNDSGINKDALIFAIFTILFCVLGMLGNSLVIWLLGSSVKRNNFAIYILNLSVADFGFLTFELIIKIHWLFTHLYCGFPYQLFQTGLLLMYSAEQFLLTVISIDKCISVLFPIWFQSHRPVHLFTTVCAVIWTVSFILSTIRFTIKAVDGFGISYTLRYQFTVNVVLCLPLMAISSVILFIKICFVSNTQRRRKLLTTMLLKRFFFFTLAFPLNAILLTRHISASWYRLLVHYGYLCVCINGTINPLIYYLAGRFKGKAQKSIRDVFQRIFKEEENCTDQMGNLEGSNV